jgi:hypothetical protein
MLREECKLGVFYNKKAEENISEFKYEDYKDP